MESNTKLNEILTKIVNVLKHDIYIIDNSICIGGKLTEDDLPGTYVCMLDHDYAKTFIDVFPGKKLLYLPDIKKVKNDPSLIEDNFNELRENNIFNRWKFIKNRIENQKTWSNIGLSPEEFNRIFEEKEVLTIKRNDLDFQVAKEMFPMIKKYEDMESLLYSTEDNGEIYDLIFKYDVKVFTLYGLYTYIKF